MGSQPVGGNLSVGGELVGLGDNSRRLDHPLRPCRSEPSGISTRPVSMQARVGLGETLALEPHDFLGGL